MRAPCARFNGARVGARVREGLRAIFNPMVDDTPTVHIFNHMVEDKHARLDLVFRALGDHTRRSMLERLARREQTVGELAAPYRMSLAAASKHIQTLERAGS